MNEKLSLATLARMPGLIIGLLFTALRYKSRARRSARKFRRAMVRGGLSRARAKQLAERYEESVRICNFIGDSADEGTGLSSFLTFL